MMFYMLLYYCTLFCIDVFCSSEEKERKKTKTFCTPFHILVVYTIHYLSKVYSCTWRQSVSRLTFFFYTSTVFTWRLTNTCIGRFDEKLITSSKVTATSSIFSSRTVWSYYLTCLVTMSFCFITGTLGVWLVWATLKCSFAARYSVYQSWQLV